MSKSLCGSCKYGCSLNLQYQKETWCSNDLFELRKSYNNWPEITECEGYEHNPNEVIQYKTPDWWGDLYTDATGQCFSDADNGL